MKRTNFSIFKRRSSGDPPEAGIDYWMTFLNGVAGRSHNREHAIHSAEIFSQCKPMLVGTGGLTLFPGTPLLEEAQRGEFDPLSEKEMLEELLRNMAAAGFANPFLFFETPDHILLCPPGCLAQMSLFVNDSCIAVCTGL